MTLPEHAQKRLDAALNRKGLRSTRQREQVYAVLHDNLRHPSADEVYALVKENLASISLATVYNCLETLVECGLLREVHFGRHPTRYEPENGNHAHFWCEKSGKVFDILLPETLHAQIKAALPDGFEVDDVTLRFRGTAPALDEETVLRNQLSHHQKEHHEHAQH